MKISNRSFVKNILGFVSLILVVLLLTGSFGMLNIKTSAADRNVTDGSPTVRFVRKGNTDISYIPKGDVFDIHLFFHFTSDINTKHTAERDGLLNKKIEYEKGANFTVSSPLVAESKASIFITGNDTDGYELVLKNVKNNGLTEDINLSLTILSSSDTGIASGDKWKIGEFKLNESYFKKDPSSSDGTTFTPDPALENIIITDKDGNRLDEITKDTPPFNIIVTFFEFGMEEIDFDDIPDKALSVSFKDDSGFYSSKGTGGILDPLLSSKDGVPRFKATFKNISYDGTAGTSLVIVPRYQIDGVQKKGEPISVLIRAAVPDKKEDEEKDKLAPLKPYIIVSQYSYGDNQIEAGSQFTLNVSFTNTSIDVPLENIVMTFTTPEQLSIASSSNTIYIPSLAGKTSLSHSVDIKAKANAAVGSADVTVEFKYQYVDTVNKKREEATTTEKIAIPITQLDKFEVNSVLEYPEFAEVGMPFDITVSFSNDGNSVTRNIKGNVESKTEIKSKGEPFGNLESGKSDTLDISVTPYTEGELIGEVVVIYEDDNNNKKEIRLPFSLFVNTPYVPERPPMVDEEVPTGKISTRTLVLSIVGGLLIAAPIAYFFTKSKIRKEGEFSDEDF